MAALCARVPVAAVRRSDPRDRELRARQDIPDGLLWVVVRDARGETLDQFWADTATGRCAEEYVARFPELLVQRIEQGLGEHVTVEEFERRWRRQHDVAAFETWADRMERMSMHRRLRVDALALAPDPELGTAGRARAFLARAHDLRGLAPQERRAFIDEGEKLLLDAPEHAHAPAVRGALVSAGYLGGFDVEARCNDGIARLSSLPAHVAAIAAERDRALERLRKSLVAAPEGAVSRASIAAALGDAETTIRVFTQPPFDANPEYAEWVRDARDKLDRSRPQR